MAGGDEHAGLSHNAAPLLPGCTVKKIALFADVQNLYYTVRQAHGCHFHYAELWRSRAVVQPADMRPPRRALTSIYFLLAAGERSRLHAVLEASLPAAESM